MSELAIHHFSLSLVRKGGCGWGAGRERIFSAMQQALPAAVGEAFAARLAAHADLAITDPIQLDVRLSLAEIIAACTSPVAMALLANQIAAAWTPPEVNDPVEPIRIDTALEQRAIDPVSPTNPRDTVVTTLLEWHRRSVLVTMLAGFSVGALRSWLAAIVPSLPAVEPVIVDALVGEHIGTPQLRDADIREVLRDVLVEVVQNVADMPSGQPSASAVEVLVRAAARRSTSARRDVDRAMRSIEPTHLAVASVPITTRMHPVAPPRIATTVTIQGYALPFLLLRPLSQIHCLDAVAASCAANALPPSGFAAALALSVLRPPDRGWRHHPDDLATATAIAGEITLPALAFRDARDIVAPIDRALAHAVLAGHDARRALLLHRSAEGFLIVEPDGLFPIAWQETLEDVLAVASPIGSLLAVTAVTADSETLAAVDAHGLRFVTNAPPSRHERWRRLAGARAWTNDQAAADAALASHAAVLHLAEDVDELVTTLASRRPRDLPPPIARSSGLAAAVALGDIAHRLWCDREPTSPQLALARLGDLSARIGISPDQIDVRIPHGARHRDLARAGFLVAPTVPWLDALTIGVG